MRKLEETEETVGNWRQLEETGANWWKLNEIVELRKLEAD